MGIKLKSAPQGAARTGQVQQAAPVEMPEIREVTAEDLGTSVLLIGASGTGKSHALGEVMRHGYSGLILALEPKIQAFAKYKPKTIFLGEPVKTGGSHRAPTPKEMYDRLMRFKDMLGEGKWRAHDGKPFDFIGIDGFLELGDVIYRYWKQNKPVAQSTGSDNSFAMWDNIAERSIDFFKALRDAAGFASAIYGLPPVSVIATIGEEPITDKMGSVRHIPLFPGKKASTTLPYCFEAVIRLSVRNIDGTAQYVAHTVGRNDPTETEKFYAKCPSGVGLDAEVVNPDFGDMFERLLASYKVSETSNNTNKEAV